MQTVLTILRRWGGYRPDLSLRIENPPYLPLILEATDESGPLGLPVVSVAHYGEQNGDPMRDPEMLFELSRPILSTLRLVPFYWRNDYVAVEQFSRSIVGDHYVFVPKLFEQHQNFADEWDKNLRAQGFLEAFDRSRARR